MKPKHDNIDTSKWTDSFDGRSSKRNISTDNNVDDPVECKGFQSLPSSDNGTYL